MIYRSFVREIIVQLTFTNPVSLLVVSLSSEILFNGKPTDWNDIAGLDFVKKTVKEIVVFPLLRPDIFTGLRSPPKGILLFGPPGTGKTLIGILLIFVPHI